MRPLIFQKCYQTKFPLEFLDFQSIEARSGQPRIQRSSKRCFCWAKKSIYYMALMAKEEWISRKVQTEES